MIDLLDIHPLSRFLREHKTHVSRLQRTGKPEVLTVNGRAKVVVQDAAAYQRLLMLIDEWDTDHTLRDRLNPNRPTNADIPSEAVLEEVRNLLRRKR